MTFLAFIMLALMIGGGVYLLLGNHYWEVILGIALLSNGVNLLLIESSLPQTLGVDPLPQALILTAIVIGFALLSFMVAFVLNRREETGSDEIPPTGEER